MVDGAGCMCVSASVRMCRPPGLAGRSVWWLVLRGGESRGLGLDPGLEQASVSGDCSLDSLMRGAGQRGVGPTLASCCCTSLLEMVSVHITFQWPGARGVECVSLSLCLSLAFPSTESQRWKGSHVPASPFPPSAGMRKAWEGGLTGRDLFPPLQLPG